MAFVLLVPVSIQNELTSEIKHIIIELQSSSGLGVGHTLDWLIESDLSIFNLGGVVDCEVNKKFSGFKIHTFRGVVTTRSITPSDLLISVDDDQPICNREVLAVSI
jgi:hypothetical protein